MKLDVFGLKIEAILKPEGWEIFYLGSEGKKRPASDIVVPSFITEEKLAGYLADLLHEFATPENPLVRVIE